MARLPLLLHLMLAIIVGAGLAWVNSPAASQVDSSAVGPVASAGGPSAVRTARSASSLEADLARLLADSGQDSDAFTAALIELANIDPLRALEWAYQQSRDHDLISIFNTFVSEHFPSGNMEAVGQFLARHPEVLQERVKDPVTIFNSDSGTRTGALIAYGVKNDAKLTWQDIVSKLPDNSSFQELLGFALRLVEDDLRTELFLNWLQGQPTTDVSTQGLTFTLAVWSGMSGHAASLWAMQHEGKLSPVVMQMVLSAAEPATPDELLTVLRSGQDILSKGQDRELIRGLAENHAQRAALLAKLPPGPHRDYLRMDLYIEELHWTHDAQAGLRLLNELSDSGDRHQLAGKIAARLAQSSLADALAFAEQLPDEDLRRRARLNAVNEISLTEHIRAFQKNPGDWDGDMLHRLASGWASESPSQAAEMLLQRAQATHRAEALQPVFKEWLERDPEAASAWLVALPAGAARDDAASAFAVSVVEHDAPAAMEWASALNDPAQRLATQERAFQSWLSMEPNAARAWLMAADREHDPAADARLAAIAASTPSPALPAQWKRSYVGGFTIYSPPDR